MCFYFIAVSSVWGLAEWNSGIKYRRMRLLTGDSISLHIIQVKGTTNVKIKAAKHCDSHLQLFLIIKHAYAITCQIKI